MSNKRLREDRFLRFKVSLLYTSAQVGSSQQTALYPLLDKFKRSLLARASKGRQVGDDSISTILVDGMQEVFVGGNTFAINFSFTDISMAAALGIARRYHDMLREDLEVQSEIWINGSDTMNIFEYVLWGVQGVCSDVEIKREFFLSWRAKRIRHRLEGIVKNAFRYFVEGRTEPDEG